LLRTSHKTGIFAFAKENLLPAKKEPGATLI
jgi:hypothetical protein